jgi:hypothetical protein
MRRSPENQHEHPSFAVASRQQRLARHPRADVGGTTRNSNALSLAPHQEPDSLHVHETNFDQIEDDVSTARFLDAPTELGQLRGADSAAHGQDGGAGIRERTILSIEIDRDCDHTNGNPHAARNSLCGIDEPIGSHERSRVAREVSRGFYPGGWLEGWQGVYDALTKDGICWRRLPRAPSGRICSIG